MRRARATVAFRVDRPEWGRFVVRVSDPCQRARRRCAGVRRLAGLRRSVDARR